MSTQVDLFTNVEPTSVSPAIAKPFVSRSTFYQGDCLLEMDKIADKSVDMILCDLPYGTTACKWDSILPFDKLWKEYERIIKPKGAIVLTANQPFTSALIMSNPKLFRYEWIWEKSRPTGFPMAKHRPMKNHETIIVFSKSPATYTPSGFMNYYPQGVEECDRIIKRTNKHKTATNGGDLGTEIHSTQTGFPKTILKIKNTNKDSKNHPTEKPIELMEYLVKTYTNEGDMVLDNTMGSGTTILAAIKNNRIGIGIEKEKQYYDVAVRRASDYLGSNIYKNIQTKENYDKLLSSGMFWEFHPELSGNWDADRSVVQYCH